MQESLRKMMFPRQFRVPRGGLALPAVLALTPFLAFCNLLYPELTITFSLLLVLFAIVAARPLWGLFACIALFPLENVKLLWDSPLRKETVEMISFFPLPVFFTAAALIANKAVNFKAILPSLALFFAYATFSLSYTDDIYHGLNEYLRLTADMLLVLICVSLITDKERLKQVLMVIAVASPFLFAIEVSSQWVNGSVRLPLLQDIYLYFELPYHSNRPSGFAGPGVVGNILGVFVLINIALMPFFRSRTRGLLFMNIFFLSVGVVLTASKAAMGSLIMGLYLLVLLEPGLRRQAIKWSVAILAFLLLLLPAVVLLQQDVVMAKRISMAVSAGADYLKERLEWWGLGFQSLVNSYFVGDGIGGYVKLIDPYPHAHSYYFSVIFDLGLIGFVIYMYILARSLLGYVRSFPRARDREVRFASYCLFTAFVMTLVYGLVDEEYTYRLVFLFIGLGLSLKNIITHAPEAGSAREEGLPLPAFARRG